MDVFQALQYLLPRPLVGGCCPNNTQAEYEALRWEDTRPKPTWDALVAAYPQASITLQSLYAGLTLDQRLQFLPIKNDFNDALFSGDKEAAKALLDRLQVDAGLAATKAKMLTLI